MNSIKKETVVKDVEKYDCDGCLITSHYSRYWYTDFPSSAGYLIITKNQDVLLIDERYFEAAKNQIHGIDVRPFKKLDDLKDTLKNMNLRRVLVEKEYITLEELEMIWRMNVETVGATARQWRIIKDKKAIAALRESAQIAAETIEWIRHENIIGKTEKEVSGMIAKHMLEKGATGNSFDPLIVATGKNGAVPHHYPDDTILEEGNLVTVDIGCMYNHYASDITRTFALGEKLNDPKLEELYNTVLEANLKGIAAVKADAYGNEVDQVCRDYIESFDQYKGYFTHATGHGVGLEVHEVPYVSPRSKNLLPNHSCCTVEPGIYVPGLGGARVEDTLLVTEDGCEILTNFAKKNLYND